MLVSAGLSVCCLPITTELLAKATSGSANPNTPFSTDELIRAADATRDYTVGDHDISELIATLGSINGAEELSALSRYLTDEQIEQLSSKACAACSPRPQPILRRPRKLWSCSKKSYRTFKRAVLTEMPSPTSTMLTG